METMDHAFQVISLREIDLNITNRCNLDCRHCAFASHIGDTNELSLATIRSIIEDASALGCKEIHLTGGEPTIHSEFEKVLELILQSGMFTRLISNGVMPKSRLQRYFDMGLRHLLFSIDGMQESHDRIRGRSGLFEKTLSRAADAKDMGYSVRVNAVAMQDNLHDLVPLYHEVSRIGIDTYSVFLYTPTGRNAQQQLNLMIQPNQWRDFKMELHSLCQNSTTEVFVEKGYQFPDDPDLNWAEMAGRGGGCHYLSSHMDYLLITGTGDVFPCALLNDKAIPYGNIKERRLSDIILHPSPHYRTYQKFQEPSGKCGSCNLWQKCHGGCRALAYAFNKGDWDNPDPFCTSTPPAYIPLCPLFKQNLNRSQDRHSGFSESVG